MQELTPIVQALAALVSVVYSIIRGNFFAIFNLAGPVLALKNVDFSKVLVDLSKLTEQDLKTLEGQFDAAVSVSDQVVAKKIADIANGLHGAVTVGEEVVKVYDDAMAVVAKFKTIVGE